MRYRLTHPTLVPAALAALAAPFLLAAYLPSMSAYLAFDDFAHIAPLYKTLAQPGPTNLWEAIWSSYSGPTGRPLAMATFAAQIGLFEADIVHLKLLNLLIHLATGILLYRIGVLLLAAVRAEPSPTTVTHGVALVAALLWLLHPFNLTSVAYTIQRMNSLATLFTALAITTYLRLRVAQTNPKDFINGIFVIGLLWACGVLSKENAALLPLYILVIEGFVLRGRTQSLAMLVRSRTLQTMFVLIALALAATVVVYLQQRIIGGYAGRPFSLNERLLTESRVVVWYLRQLLFPDIWQMSLYHDDWPVSTGILMPSRTILSIVFLLGLMVGSWLVRKRIPLVAFGLFWFLAGHLLESTLLPLELVYEHRNYLPGFAPLLTVTYFAAMLLQRISAPRSLFAAATIAVVTLLAWGTHQRAERWSDDPSARLEQLNRQERSMRAQIEAAQTYAELAQKEKSPSQRNTLLGEAEEHFARASELPPRNADPLFGWLIFRFQHGRQDAMKLLPELHQRLAQAHFSATTTNGIHALTLCVTKGPCKGLSEELVRIFDAMMDNKTLGASGRNRLLRDQARYRAHRQQDPGAAIQYLKQAVQLAPTDVDTRIDYAYYAALAGDQKTALAQLDQASSIDWLGRKAHTLRTMRLAIMQGTLTSFL